MPKHAANRRDCGRNAKNKRFNATINISERTFFIFLRYNELWNGNWQWQWRAMRKRKILPIGRALVFSIPRPIFENFFRVFPLSFFLIFSTPPLPPQRSPPLPPPPPPPSPFIVVLFFAVLFRTRGTVVYTRRTRSILLLQSADYSQYRMIYI